MQKFVIEREIPGIGESAMPELREGAEASCAAAAEVGPGIHWLYSYVTEDKTFCVYLAEGEQVIRDHAEAAGLPANTITPVERLIDPTTRRA